MIEMKLKKKKSRLFQKLLVLLSVLLLLAAELNPVAQALAMSGRWHSITRTLGEGADAMTVTVEIPDGAFSVGANLRLSPVTLQPGDETTVLDAVQETDSRLLRTVRISFHDFRTGKEVEPRLPLRVTVTSSLIAAYEETVVVELRESGDAETVQTIRPGREHLPAAQPSTEAAADSAGYRSLVQTVLQSSAVPVRRTAQGESLSMLWRFKDLMNLIFAQEVPLSDTPPAATAAPEPETGESSPLGEIGTAVPDWISRAPGRVLPEEAEAAEDPDGTADGEEEIVELEEGAPAEAPDWSEEAEQPGAETEQPDEEAEQPGEEALTPDAEAEAHSEEAEPQEFPGWLHGSEDEEEAEAPPPEAPDTLWELPEDGEAEEPYDDSSICFEIDQQTTFALVGVSLKTTVLASDGHNYRLTVRYPADAGLPEDAALEAAELPPDDPAYAAYVASSEDALGMAAGEAEYVRLFDIKLVDGNGEKLQPAVGHSVEVSIELADAEGAQFSVVHFSDGADVGQVLPASTQEEKAARTVTFSTNGFSIYSIIDDDGNVVTPRAEYRFEDANGELISSQIIKHLEQLREVAATEVENKVLLGWFLYDPVEQSYGDQIRFNTPITVVFGDEAAVFGTGVISTQEIQRQGAHQITVRPRYTSNFGSVRYLRANESSVTANDQTVIRTDRVAVPDGENTVTYTLPLPADLSTEGQGQYRFVGWSTSAPRKSNRTYQYFSTSDTRSPVSEVTVTKGETLTLYPVFKQAYWITYFTAPVGAGATYVPPAWVENGKAASNGKPAENPSWRGYHFLYWTETPTFDEEGSLIAFETAPAAYDFSQKPNRDIILYAWWEPGWTTYTVVHWKQSVTNDKDAAPWQRSYDFEEQQVVDVKLGTRVTAADVAIHSYEGFHHREEEPRDTGSLAVDASGSSVYNVYYDRDLVTMKFYDGKSGEPKGGYSDSVWKGTVSTSSYYVFTGLYGQTLEQNGYTWPTAEWWFYTTSGTQGMSFLGQFVLPTNTRDTKQREIRLFSKKPGSNIHIVEFYLENEDGTGYELDTRAQFSGSLTFYFSDKYDGFHVQDYRRFTGSVDTATGNVPNRSYTDKSWKSAWTADGNYGSVELGTSYHLEVRYSRSKYDILYLDPMDNTSIAVKLRNGEIVQQKTGVFYEAALADYYPDPDYEPASRRLGYEFNGRWYMDQAQTVQIFFHAAGDFALTEQEEVGLWYYVDASGEKYYTDYVPDTSGFTWAVDEDGTLYDTGALTMMDARQRTYGQDGSLVYTEMPMHDIPVYAGYRKVWYWIRIDPDGGELHGTDSTWFWETYGEKVIEYVTDRKYVQDPEGDYYYHYDELDPVTELNQYGTNVRKAAYRLIDGAEDWQADSYDGLRYRLAGEQEGYGFVGWYEVNADGSLSPYSFETEITHNLTLRAVWAKKGKLKIRYSMEKVLDLDGSELGPDYVLTGTAPEDPFGYAENATSLAKSGQGLSLVQPEEDQETYVFYGWYYDGRVISEGNLFEVLEALATERSPGSQSLDTIVLYPVFSAKQPVQPPEDLDRTSIILDANGGHRVADFELPENGAWNEGTLILYVEDMQVNAAVTLPTEPVYEMDDPNIEFLGWAFSPTARLPNFLAGETVGVDNEEGNGYQGGGVNYLYAVWHLKSVSLRFRKVSAEDALPLDGAEFALGYPETQEQEDASMVSGEEGYLRFADGETTEIVVLLPTSMDPEEPYVYTLTETAAPEGYLPLTDSLRISVSFDGAVRCDGDFDWDLSEKDEDGVYTLTIPNLPGESPDGGPDITLPATGGPGVGGVTALGALLSVGAGLYLLLLRRRNRTSGKQRGASF